MLKDLQESKIVINYLNKQVQRAKSDYRKTIKKLIESYFASQVQHLQIDENTSVKILTDGTYLCERDNYLGSLTMKSIGKSKEKPYDAYCDDQLNDDGSECSVCNPENISGCFLVSDCGSVIAYYLPMGDEGQPSSFELYPADQVYLITIGDADYD